MTTLLVKKTKSGEGKFELGPGLAAYEVLRARIGEVFVEGRRRVEAELVRMRYHTGLLINEHVRLNRGRAEYGSRALLKLEKDCAVDESELRRYSVFAQAYPIQGRGPELRFNLPWRVYRKLMVIADDEKRREMTLEAEKKGWSFETVEARVRFLTGKERAKEDEPPRLPPVCLGTFYTYRIIESVNIHSKEKELLLDTGFRRRLEMRLFPGVRFGAGTIVISKEAGNGRFRLERSPVQCPAKGPGADSILYTFKACVMRVIDGDTLVLDVHPGFGERFEDTFRLNGIDCPEIDTPGRPRRETVRGIRAGEHRIRDDQIECLGPEGEMGPLPRGCFLCKGGFR